MEDKCFSIIEAGMKALKAIVISTETIQYGIGADSDEIFDLDAMIQVLTKIRNEYGECLYHIEEKRPFNWGNCQYIVEE
jgi:hypothetical protein